MAVALVLDSPHNNFTCHAAPPDDRPAIRLFPDSRGCGGREVRTLYCVNCGAEISVPVSCGDRTCPDCRYVQFLRLRRRYLPKVKACEVGRLALVTLTLRIGPEDSQLAERVQRIRRAWSQLVRLAVWRPVDGGLAVIEAKWSSRYRNTWNVHIHALCEVGQVVRPFRYWSDGQGEGFRGRVFKRQKTRKLGADLLGAGQVLTPQALSDAWHRLTGDSYIVDIQPVRKLPQGRGGPKGALCYILKYLAKDMGWLSPAAREAYNAAMTVSRRDAAGNLRRRTGRRIVMTFGTWHPTCKRYRFLRGKPAPAPCRACQSTAGWLSVWDMIRLAGEAYSWHQDTGPPAWPAPEERPGPAPGIWDRLTEARSLVGLP